MIQRIQITRIQELEDMDQDIGGHTLVIHYPSILVGSRVTIVSYKEA
jgi:predicted thioesterase